MSMGRTLAVRLWDCFSNPDRSRGRSHEACRKRLGPRVVARPVGAGALADELAEAAAERPERRAADLEADLGDRQVAAAEQGHRPLDAPGHEVAVGGLAEGGAEAPGEVARRHARRPRQCLHVERAGVLAVHLVAGAPEEHQVFAFHPRIIAPPSGRPLRAAWGGRRELRAPPAVAALAMAAQPEPAGDATRCLLWAAPADPTRPYRTLLTFAPYLVCATRPILRPTVTHSGAPDPCHA